MGETGKRPRSGREKEGFQGQNQFKKPFRENSDGELIVYRLLCPENVVGSLIGKSGKVINSLRQETKARIKIVDPFPGSIERIVTIYCFVNEKKNADFEGDNTIPLCAAQDALLRVHKTIFNAISNIGDSEERQRDEARLLVPASQAANIIGKSGATIKKIRAKTRANIKVFQKDPEDPTHSCAMSFDNFVSITGDEETVRRALFVVSAIMYKFSPKEEISLETTLPLPLNNVIIPSEVPIFSSGNVYSNADAVIPPPRSSLSMMGGPAHLPEFHGYGGAGSSWPGYLPPAIPVLPPSFGGPHFEDLVIRILCPPDKIGRVIGKGGSSIKSVRQATGARVDVDDPKNASEQCIVTVTSSECSDDQKSGAVEAVLLLLGKINGEDAETVEICLLVPSKTVGCLIGKGGSVVNEMRKTSKAVIRISKGEKPKYCGPDDELVEVQGNASCVRDALVQVVLRLRDAALKQKEDSNPIAPPVEPRYSSGHMAPSVLPSFHNAAPLAPSFSSEPRIDSVGGYGIHAGSTLYGYGSFQSGDGGYGSVPSYLSQSYGGLPTYIEVVIPTNAVGKVFGKGGSNLANIRKISGANVEVVDSKSVRGERVAQISGTSEQRRSAENLIQAFIMSS